MKGLVVALLLTVAVSGGDADLKTTSGAPFSISELLGRGPVVLVFWNSWLPESQEFLALLPEVETAAERHGWPGALIVFQDASPQAAGKLPAGVARFPRVLDRRGELVRRFQVTRAPAVLLVEPGGEVRARAGPAPADVRELLRGMAKR